MRTSASIVALALVLLGCGRDLTEYELDQRSFGATTIAKIQKESGINLPTGCKGLKFHHKPPIDPIVFAKLEIPPDQANLMEQRLAVLTNSIAQFPDNFANNICHWWPTNLQNVIISKKVYQGYYIEAHLTREHEMLVLYLKYFTL